MIVVSDSSPLIVLNNINHIDVLPKLFGEVIIPPAVASELSLPSRPRSVRDFVSSGPNWLRIQRPAKVQQIPELHLGELEALSLAIELRAEIVLVDERKAYRRAVALRLNAIGTVRVLEQAAAERLIDLRDAFDRIKQTDFWISHKLLDERFRIFQEQQKRGAT
jgi:predicted nucleic acid-binding protein